MLTLYGLKSCNTCRTVNQELKGAGKDVTFVDVRENRLDSDLIERFHREFGDALVNRRSTTWRNLPETERKGPAKDLISRHPSLMKRPVIVDGTLLTLGWDAATKLRHLGNSENLDPANRY